MHAVVVDADLREHFGGARGINAALRAFVEVRRLIDAERRKTKKGRAAYRIAGDRFTARKGMVGLRRAGE